MSDTPTNDIDDRDDDRDTVAAERADESTGPANDGGSGADGAGPNDGTCRFAIPAALQLGGQDRPTAWQGRAYGLVVHSTPREIPATARKKGVHHMVEAAERYLERRGCHYINGWTGIDGGDLLQLANERTQADGVGVTNDKDPSKDQRHSINAGRFEADLPPVLVRLWRQRWPDYHTSLDLLPGTKTANSCYIHVECVPCVFHLDGQTLIGEGVEPMRRGLRFTRAQHDAVAALALDVALRNGWQDDEEWWRTPRLLGHEDLTPISRHDTNGGWDPGYLREAPYFDWDYVYAQIEQIRQRGEAEAPATDDEGLSIVNVVDELRDRLSEMVRSGQDGLAVALAHQRGLRDVNEITNLIFFARHPEMNGRKIDSHETALAQEWIDVRDTVVRPALDRLSAESERQ
jgi:N-acetylmuramoyl-L-alanine amidase